MFDIQHLHSVQVQLWIVVSLLTMDASDETYVSQVQLAEHLLLLTGVLVV